MLGDSGSYVLWHCSGRVLGRVLPHYCQMKFSFVTWLPLTPGSGGRSLSLFVMGGISSSDTTMRIFSLPLGNGESPDSIKPPLTPPQRKREGLPRYCPGYPYCFHWPWCGMGETVLILTTRNESPDPYLIFSDTTVMKVLGTSLQLCERKCLVYPPSLCWYGWWWGHSFFCGVWLEWSCYYLKVSVFLSCPFPGPSTREDFVAFFFWSVPIGISGLLPSSTPSLGYEAKRLPRELIRGIIPHVPKSLASLTSYLLLS